METRAHHVIIGLFTLLGLLLALGFGVWQVKSGQQQESRFYRVVFEEAVSGLSVGSAVQYNGLRVGEVRRLQLDPTDPRRVLADVEVSSATPINQGTRARLAIANITGAANILLSTEDPDAPPLLDSDTELPVLLAEPSPIGALLGSGEALMTGISELVARSSALLSTENIARIERTLEHLEQLSATLAEEEGVAATLTSLRETSEEMGATVRQVRPAAGGAGYPPAGRRQQAMHALARSSRQLEQLLDRNAGALDSGMQGMAELGPVMQELQLSLGTLNRILSRLEEDPAGYLTGQAPAPEFNP